MGNAESSLPGRAVAAAAAAAALGAGLWAFVIVQFQYEFAMIAWAIAAGVGGLFHHMGGRGRAGALLCVGLTVAAIGVGKYVAVDRLLEEQRAMVRSALGGRETYEAMKATAEAFQASVSDEELEEMMEEEGLGEEGATVEEIRAEAEFPETYEQYQAQMAQAMEIDEMEILLESLTAFDALFFGLAVFTAWQLAMGKGRMVAAVAPAYRTRPREQPEDAAKP
jgi:hypothetical protein